MITSDGNKIFISGTLGMEALHNMLASIHSRVVKGKYQDIALDFSKCDAAFPGPMVAVCSQVNKHRRESIDFTLKLPNDEKLSRLFSNANWAYLIDPFHHNESTFKGLRQIPTTQFASFEEQSQAVNNILDVILSSLDGFERTDLAAIEWSLNEITDNVINHAQSDVGGFIQLSTFRRDRQRVEYVVCDAGIGIPNSLRSGIPTITSDLEAIDFAIREGITRNKKSNQGNGLYGAFEISRVSEGYMEIHSGYASLHYDKKSGLHMRKEPVPFTGTLIISCIDYSNPGLLGDALKFKGLKHTPVDYIETKFEDSSGKRVVFNMKKESTSFGSRKAAEPVHIKLKNIASLCGNCKVFVDFDDVSVISSSFADEVFGKLFISMGPLAFIQKFEFMNVNDTVRSLIDRAISLRSSI